MPKSAQTSDLRDRIKLKAITSQLDFATKHPHARALFEDAGVELGNIRQHSAKLLTAGTLGGALLLSPTDGSTHASLPQSLAEPVFTISAMTATSSSPQDWLVSQLSVALPPITNAFNPPFLNSNQEKIVGQIIERATGIPATASLEGEHLNTSFGYIGAEQHLRRYPGDTIAKHDSGYIQNEGMAPGLGGFGYFTGPDGKLSEEDALREKYYVVAQLMYLPDWNKRVKYLIDWYKWRKMIVVNTENGHAVVGVMGDAGPAAWTGKHFGASPEVMDALGGQKYKKGKVLMFFVDDPENKIPLGPVLYDYTKVPGNQLTDLNEAINKAREKAEAGGRI